MQRLVAEIYRLDGMGRVDYEPDPATSVAAQSTAAGRHPLDVFYDLLIADGCRAILIWFATSYASSGLGRIAEF